MQFIDEVNIKVQAGKGGDGMISFRREYRVDKGGPDGGDGGSGGSIFFVGDPGVNTLVKFKFNKNIFGQDGEDGKKKKMYGAKGADLYFKVPLGTLVYAENKLLHDITRQEPYLIAQGGKGGRGNTKFKTARNTAPKISENGDPGEKFELKLVLKVIADIGFVGKPSAGKSTLLAKITNAKAKVGDYAFTTVVPQLGILYLNQDESLVLADLPGLIKGAAQGKGLGHEFLKHVERCRIIAHIIDFGDPAKNPIADYLDIQHELVSYALALEKRTQVIIANKIDLPCFQAHLEKFKAQFPHLKIVPISALKENNLKTLKHKLWTAFTNSKPLVFTKKSEEVTIEFKPPIVIEHPFNGLFEVSGKKVAQIYHKIPLNSWENFQRFSQKMRVIGVWAELTKQGVKEGDLVRIFGYEFVWGEENF